MTERLDIVVARRTGLSRAAAARLVDEGRVTVDGRSRPKSHRVQPGERVEVEAARGDTPEAPPANFQVVHEDEHLLVIDKPAGVVVHPGAGHASGTLAQALRGVAAGGPDPERGGIVHRLDRDTSGLMLVARSEEAHRALQPHDRRAGGHSRVSRSRCRAIRMPTAGRSTRRWGATGYGERSSPPAATAPGRR